MSLVEKMEEIQSPVPEIEPVFGPEVYEVILGVGADISETAILENKPKVTCAPRCPRCRSWRGQWRGYRKRKDGTIAHRRWCTQCGKWHFKVM